MAPPGDQDPSSVKILSQTVFLNVSTVKQACSGWSEIGLEVPISTAALLFQTAGLAVTCVLVNGVEVQLSPSKAGADSPLPLEAPSLETVTAAHIRHFKDDLSGHVASVPMPSVLDAPLQHAHVTVAFRFGLRNDYGTMLCHGGAGAGPAQGPWPRPLFPELLSDGRDVIGPQTPLRLFLVVPEGHVAVASGKMLECRAHGSSQRRYEYLVAQPATPSIAAGALHGRWHRAPAKPGDPCIVLHAPQSAVECLEATAAFLGLLNDCYSDKLLVPLPLEEYTQVFVPPGVLTRPHITPGWAVHPTTCLVTRGCDEGATGTRLELAAAFAKQVFGLALRPASPADAWLVTGLAAWLVDQFIREYLGRNELQYRKWKASAAVCTADDGSLPPLASQLPGGAATAAQLLAGAFPLSEVMELKAAAVVRLLERRAGEDLFRKHVQTSVAAALSEASTQAAETGAGAPSQTSATPPSRTLDATQFVTELGRLAGFRKDVPAFFARWVLGSGTPRITAGFVYHAGPQRRSVLELALRQEGGTRAAAAAAAAATRVSDSAGAGVGILRVSVQEAEAAVEHPVHLGAEPWKLAELKVNPDVKKVPGRRGAKRRKVQEEAQDESAALLSTLEGVENPLQPVQWVRIDPGGEWLCSVWLEQPLRCWVAQLAHSRDVVAQAEAVAALAQHPSLAAVAALVRCFTDESVYHRVRADAAVALGRRTEGAGVPEGIAALLAFYKKHFWDATLDAPVSCAQHSLSEKLVGQAIIRALGLSRDDDGTTPIDVLLFLSTALEQFPSDLNAHETSDMLAALCSAVGNIRHDLFTDAALVLLERSLHRELVCPSPSGVVGQAVVGALATLGSGPGASPDDEIWRRVRATLASIIADGDVLPELATAATAARLRLELAARGPEAAVAGALRALRVARGSYAKASVVGALLCAGATLGALLSPRLDGGEGTLQPVCLLELEATASAAVDPELRHALHALMRMLLGGSLAVEDAEEDGPAPAEDDVSAPQRITLRLPSALPTISGDDQPVLGQANAAPPSEAAPLPKSGGAAEGCDEPAALSDVGAQSAAFKFVLKLPG
uniref:Transcription initiation factor TFIID subunit 2 n=2 Tax=Auxenochlorella protothecoides TaxID=3075 RepID=A0A1D2A1I6_AUXPR